MQPELLYRAELQVLAGDVCSAVDLYVIGSGGLPGADKEFAGDRDVDVAAGPIGSQALKLGLIDQVVVNQR